MLAGRGRDREITPAAGTGDSRRADSDPIVGPSGLDNFHFVLPGGYFRGREYQASIGLEEGETYRAWLTRISQPYKLQSALDRHSTHYLDPTPAGLFEVIDKLITDLGIDAGDLSRKVKIASKWGEEQKAAQISMREISHPIYERLRELGYRNADLAVSNSPKR